MRIAILHHLEVSFLGHVAALHDAGAELDEYYLRDGDPLPSIDEVDGIVSLGGEQSVREIDQYDYLLAEVSLVREAVVRAVPLLGVCLGAQLLAHALGADIRRASARSVQWRDLRPTAAGATDPLIAALPEPVPALHWNEDVFDLPPGGIELLERPAEGVEAFRAANAWGVQFHPDVDPPNLDGWYATYAAWLAEASVTEAEARTADDAHFERHAASSRALFAAFARVVAGR